MVFTLLVRTKDVLHAAGNVFNAIFKGVLYRLVGAMSCSRVGVWRWEADMTGLS